MKVNERTRRVLAYRREHREMLRAGWEYVGERGGDLWELYRGKRVGYKIIDAKAAIDGLGIWVKIEDFRSRDPIRHK